MNGKIFLQQDGSEIVVVACGRRRNELFWMYPKINSIEFQRRAELLGTVMG